jgi:hypothetical protein
VGRALRAQFVRAMVFGEREDGRACGRDAPKTWGGRGGQRVRESQFLQALRAQSVGPRYSASEKMAVPAGFTCARHGAAAVLGERENRRACWREVRKTWGPR